MTINFRKAKFYFQKQIMLLGVFVLIFLLAATLNGWPGLASDSCSCRKINSNYGLTNFYSSNTLYQCDCGGQPCSDISDCVSKAILSLETGDSGVVSTVTSDDNKKDDETQAVANAVYLKANINVGPSDFMAGETLNFSYSIKNSFSKSVRVSYQANIYCPSAPNALSGPREASIGPNSVLSEEFKGSIVDSGWEPSDCQASITLISASAGKEAVSVEQLSLVKKLSIKTKPGFEFSIYANKNDSVRSRSFLPTDKITLNFSSSILDATVFASLIYPSGKVENFSLPKSFRTKEYGSYKFKATASKQGYKINSAKMEFSVSNLKPVARKFLGFGQELISIRQTSQVKEPEIITISNLNSYNHFKGMLILLTADLGKLYYINPTERLAYYIPGATALLDISKGATGISKVDISKIKFGFFPDSSDLDSDGDGLPNWLENELGSDQLSRDSDGDGFFDDAEFKFDFNLNGYGYAPWRNNSFASKHIGKFFKAVQGSGKTYFVNPSDKKLYPINSLADAQNIIMKLPLGISNEVWKNLVNK